MNNYLIAVFRARTQTLIFSNVLKSQNISNSIINTPRNFNASCGISVKFPIIHKHIAEMIIKRKNLNTFIGFF